MLAAGIRLRHIEEAKPAPMYVSSIETVPAGGFAGPMVVTMRPLAAGNVTRANAITARYPHAHGAPVHAGDPATIGIADLGAPDWEAPVALEPGEVPVFWACGVTPQVALAAARPPLAITHVPGAMLITDLRADGAPERA